MAGTDDDLIFKGLKVLDVGTWIAGPVSATILADFGADVIKVEQPIIGDPYRRFSELPGTPKARVNYDWVMDARNKRGIALNLKTPEGKEALLKLVRQCDVYVTNQVLPLRRQLGLMYEDLKPLNEKMIYASLTPYGEQGPEIDREGFDGVAWWTRTGLADLVRVPGVEPGGSVAGMGDHPTAVSLYAAIVTALLRRERTGQGAHVHTSLLHNGLWSNACLANAAFVGDADYSQYRTMTATMISPNRRLFPAADGRLLQLYMVRTQEEVDALLVAAEAGHILGDERFADVTSRTAHMVEFIAALEELFLQKTAKEWMAIFRANRVPVSLVAIVEELADDPQVIANAMSDVPSDPSVNADRIIKHPINIDGMARVGPTAPPEIGQHTDEVLAELGYSATEIAGMHARGVI